MGNIAVVLYFLCNINYFHWVFNSIGSLDFFQQLEVLYLYMGMLVTLFVIYIRNRIIVPRVH